MAKMISALKQRSARPFLLLLLLCGLFAIVDTGHGRFVNTATLFSVLQQFATIGPVALGLGLTMIAREYDLSVGGVMSLAGCVAVLTGETNPAIGLATALLVGSAYGLAQGTLQTKLRIGSVGITLGGLLIAGGLTYVITDNMTIGYGRSDIAAAVNAPTFGVLSLRAVSAFAAYSLAIFFFSFKKI